MQEAARIVPPRFFNLLNPRSASELKLLLLFARHFWRLSDVLVICPRADRVSLLTYISHLIFVSPLLDTALASVHGTSKGSLTRARLHAGDRRRDRAARNTARNKVRNWPHANKCARVRMHKSMNSCPNVPGQKSPGIKSRRRSGTHSRRVCLSSSLVARFKEGLAYPILYLELVGAN